MPEGAHKIKRDDVEDFASHTLNGRQIKNFNKSALLLCHKDGKPLDIGHVGTILGIKAA
jgi:hypothetical protein